MRDSIIALLKGSMVLTLSNICMKAINFFLLPLYTKYLTPEQLGTSDTIVTFTSLIFPILVLGLDSAYSAFYFDEDTDAHKNKVFSSIFTILIITSVIPIIGTMFSNKLSLLLFNNVDFAPVIKIALLGICCNLWYLPFSLYLRVENRMTAFAIINTIASLLMIISNILTVSIFKMGAAALIISTLFTNFIVLIIYCFASKKRYHIDCFDLKLSEKLLKYSIPLVPMTISSWILVSSDRMILLHFIGQASVGLYGIATRFVNIVNVFTNSLYTAYTTFAFQSKNEKNSKEIYALILDALNLVLLLIVFLVSIFSKEIINIMADINYQESAYILPPLLFAQVLYASNTIVSYGLAFEKKSLTMLFNITVAAISNFLLNMLCIPYFGAYGAAVTTWIGNAVMLLMTYYAAQRVYYCPYHFKRVMLTNTVLLICSMVSIYYLTFYVRAVIYVFMSIILVFMHKNMLVVIKKGIKTLM